MRIMRERLDVLKAAGAVEKMGLKCRECGEPKRFVTISKTSPDRHQLYQLCSLRCRNRLDVLPVWEKNVGQLPGHEQMVKEIFEAATKECAR